MLNAFFLAMARDAHIMKEAQQLLDNPLGGERSLKHSDMDQLAHITAIIKETL